MLFMADGQNNNAGIFFFDVVEHTEIADTQFSLC